MIGMPDGSNLASSFLLSLNRVVDSIAALRATNHLFYARAFVTGYYAAHDGGGGAYQYDPNDTTSADNGGTIIVAADGARWKLAYTGAVSVRQFGAKGDGSTDDTSAFSRAASIGGKITVPALFNAAAAVYVVSTFSLLVNGTHLEGDGEGIVTLKGNSAANIIEIGNGSNNPNQITVSGLTFDYTSAQTANAAVRVRRGTNVRIRNFQITANCFNGLDLNGAADRSQLAFYVSDFQIYAKNNGIQFGADNTPLQGVYVQNGEIRGCVSGLYIQNLSGGTFYEVDATICTNGVVVSPNSASAPAVAIFFTKVMADTCTDWGWIIKPGTGASVIQVTLTDCWSSSNGTATNAGGLSVQGSGTVKMMQINGGYYTDNKGNGIDVNLPSGPYEFNGVSCVSNSQSGSASHHGLSLKNAGDVNIMGGTYGNGALSSNFQDYGIYVDTGNTKVSVIGADLDGNISGPLKNLSGNDLQVMGCPAYRTFDDGETMLPSGQSSITITPNVDAPFTQADINISPQGDPVTVGIGGWWISSVTSTTFTVATHAAASANWFFVWSLRTHN